MERRPYIQVKRWNGRRMEIFVSGEFFGMAFELEPAEALEFSRKLFEAATMAINAPR